MALLEGRVGESPPVLPLVPVRFAVLSEADRASYHSLRPDQPEELFAKRLARGHQCWGGYCEKRLVHAGWTATGRVEVPYLGAHLAVEDGDLYSFDSFTDPEFRGRSIAPARHSYILRSGQGIRGIEVLIAVENRSGLRVFEKLGYRRRSDYKRIRLVPWGNWTWSECREGDPLPLLDRNSH
jgi:GNAT superfamily N-acetyltransferase